MRTLPCVALLAAASSALPSILAATSTVRTVYNNSDCMSSPLAMVFAASSACTASDSCTDLSQVADTKISVKQSCTATSYAESTKTVFGSSSYVVVETYSPGTSCEKLIAGAAYLADGSCVAGSDGLASSKVVIAPDGAVTMQTFSGSSCSGTATQNSSIPASTINSDTCYGNFTKYYSSSTSSTSSSSTSTLTSAAGVSATNAVSFFSAVTALIGAVAIYAL